MTSNDYCAKIKEAIKEAIEEAIGKLYTRGY